MVYRRAVLLSLFIVSIMFFALFFSIKNNSATNINENSINKNNAVTGFAASSTYRGYAQPVSGFSSVSSVAFTSPTISRPITFSINDDFIYRYAYVSINGSAWIRISLTGSSSSGSWFLNSATGSYSIPSTSVSVGESSRNFVAVYSCKKITNGFDCNDRMWQIRPFTTTKTTSTTGSSGGSSSGSSSGTSSQLPTTGVFISLTGNDATGDGSITKPYRTLEKARDRVRVLKSANQIPAGGITVWIRAGTYERSSTFALTSQDSGTADRPITYSAYPGETVNIIGGIQLNSADFSLVWSSDSIYSRLRSEARGRVYKLILSSYTSNYGTIKTVSDFKDSAIGFLELFESGSTYRLGRWPNYVETPTGTTPETNGFAFTSNSYSTSSFSYSNERVDAWANAEDPRLIGYLGYEFADCNVPITSVNPSSNYMQTASGCYGESENGAPYYGYNLLEEIDVPGEYYLNRETGILYVYPVSGIYSNKFVVSIIETPVVSLSGTSYVILKNLNIESGRGDIVSISGGANNKIDTCTIKNAGRHGIILSGNNNGVFNSEITQTGYDGIRVSGGDKTTLAPSNNYITNNEIHHTGRFSPTYSPAVNLLKSSDGYAVGVKIDHNYIHDIDGMAIYYHGNNHIIEYNEIARVVENSADMGAIYTADFWTSRGTTIRYNYIHDIMNNPAFNDNVVGIYFDNTINNQSAYGNIIENVRGWCVFHASGPYINIQNNIFVNCERGAYHIHSVGVYQSWIVQDLYDMYSIYTNSYWRAAYPALAQVARPSQNSDGSWNYDAVRPYDNPDHSLASKNIAWESSPFLFFWDSMYTDRALTMQNNIDNSVQVNINGAARTMTLASPSAVSNIGFVSIPFSQIGRYAVNNTVFSYSGAGASTNSTNTTSVSGQAEGGLVSWWKLDGDVQDSAGSLVGVNNGALQTSTKCAFGSCYSFNGETYIDMPLNNVFNNLQSNDFSFSFWFNAEDVSGSVWTWTRLLESRFDNNNFVQFVFGNNDGELQFIVESDGTQRAVQVNSPILNNKLYFVVGTWDADTNTLKMYLDGTLQTNEGNADASPGNEQKISIGRRTDGNSDTYYTGTIDEIKVWNKVLSQSEISTEYNFVSNGEYSGQTTEGAANIEIVAFGDSAAGVDANMIVLFDDVTKQEIGVFESVSTYSYSENNKPEVVSIVFDNDYYVEGEEDRNLFIKSISVNGNNLDLESCTHEAGCWYENGELVFPTNCRMDCNTGSQGGGSGGGSSSAEIIKVWASDYESNTENYASKTLDGVMNEDSRWASFGDNQWIAYELSETANVNYVRLAFYTEARRYFDIQYSTDGTNWQDTSAVDVASAANMANQYQTFTFNGVNAKYIRILGHGSASPSTLWNSIVETDINGFGINLDAGSNVENDPDLISYWTFDSYGDTVSDSTGNNNGILGGGATAYKPVSSEGIKGNSYYFDGVNDKVSVGQMDIAGNAMTISAWIKTPDITSCAQSEMCSQGRIISKATGINEEDHYWMLGTWYEGGSKLRFRLRTNGVVSTLIASSGNIQDNTWTHVVAVYDGNYMILYKDGTEVGRMVKSGSINTNTQVATWIGDNPPSPGSKAWKGNIDELMVFDRALSLQEVQSLYSSGSTGYTGGGSSGGSSSGSGSGGSSGGSGASQYCGDNSCNNYETCSTCSADCGSCSSGGSSESTGSCQGNAGELLVVNEEYTYDDSLHGFKFWDISDVENSPSSWLTPYNYYNGNFYMRYEVISQPTNRETNLQFGIWQLNPSGECKREIMSDRYSLNGPGSVVTAQSSPAGDSWWYASGSSYQGADRNVDFSTPNRICHIGVPLWSDNTKLISDWSSNNDWAIRNQYFPLKVKVTVVAVPQNVQFSGWDCWLNGGSSSGGTGSGSGGSSSGSSGAVSDDFSFNHYYINQNLPTVSLNGFPSLADYDNDGDLDFTTGSSYGLYLFKNPGTTNRWTSRNIAGVEVISLGAESYDVNNDGRVDVVSGGRWYQNMGNDQFTERTYDSSINSEMHDLVMADVNNDGKKDVVTLSDKFGTKWYNIPSNIGANPAQSWTRTTIDMTGTTSSPRIHGGFAPGGIGDLDGDGDNDIFRADAWFENTNNGATWTRHALSVSSLFQGSLPYGKSTRSVVIDIDNDGDNDVVFTECDKTDSKAGIWYNTNGRFTTPQLSMLPQTASGRRSSLHSIRVVDLNMDGHLDILSVDQEDMMESGIPSMRWYVWTNNGGSWTEQVLFNNGLGGHDIFAKDVDQDGDIDLVGKVWNPWDGSALDGDSHADYFRNNAVVQPSSAVILSNNVASGWHTYGNAKWDTIGGGYIQAQQNPAGSGNGGLLMSNQKFKNFEVVFDVWPDYGVDTGMYLRTTDDGDAYQITIDYQPNNPMGAVYLSGIGDSDRRSFNILDENSISGNPTYFDADAWSYIWKPNDWNQFRVRMEGDSPKITVWINGWKVEEYTDTQALLSNSGYIALQVHDGTGEWPTGKVARFRNIKVYPIS